MKHAGIHWPENAGGEHPNREHIASMPGMAGATLICSPSARYHYGYLRQQHPGAVIVWRAIPRQGSLPAQLGWDGGRVATECLNLWDEQPAAHYGTEWFVPVNELQFEKENGAPFPGYGPMAQHLGNLREALRKRLPSTVKLMFPAWVPSDDGDFLDDWRQEAERWDSLCLHAYGSAETMRLRYRSYRDVFPQHSIFVGEWNSNHDSTIDERSSLRMWAEIADSDPLFLGAAYYIWETNNAGERDLSIWGNGARYGLFLDPPVIDTPQPEPEPQPEPNPMPETYPLGIDVSNNNGRIDWNAVPTSGVQFAIAKITEGAHFRDGWFAEFWQEMKRVGLYRGAYHYALPSVYGPVQEADYFVDAFGLLGQKLEPGDVLALDLEDPAARGNLADWTLSWLMQVESRTGCKPLLYSSPAYIQAHGLAARPELAEYGLWLASWGVPTPPQAPPPWDLVAIHQTHVGGPGTIAGIPGDIDINRFNGSIDHFPLYGIPGAPHPIPPEPEHPFVVGEGILTSMGEIADTPATDEMYHGSQWSEAFGMSGTHYIYLAATGRTYRFSPM